LGWDSLLRESALMLMLQRIAATASATQQPHAVQAGGGADPPTAGIDRVAEGEGVAR